MSIDRLEVHNNTTVKKYNILGTNTLNIYNDNDNDNDNDNEIDLFRHQ